MCHVQQKNLTALHLKPKRLRRDIRTTVDSDFTRKRWLDIEYIAEGMGVSWVCRRREDLESNVVCSSTVKGLWGWVNPELWGL